MLGFGCDKELASTFAYAKNSMGFSITTSSEDFGFTSYQKEEAVVYLDILGEQLLCEAGAHVGMHMQSHTGQAQTNI